MELKTVDFITLLCVAIISVMVLKVAKLQSEIKLETDKLNNTKHANQSILIYNRVPKVSLRYIYIPKLKCKLLTINILYYQMEKLLLW